MNELINEMQRKGLISFVSRGKSQAVFNLIKVMATTRPLENSDIKLEVN